MAPARAQLEPSLAAADFRDPSVPVVTNVDASPVADGEAARDALVRQVDGAVRWSESIRWVIDEAGAETFLEVGPGVVLTGLGRRIEKAPRWLALTKFSVLEKLTAGDGRGDGED